MSAAVKATIDVMAAEIRLLRTENSRLKKFGSDVMPDDADADMIEIGMADMARRLYEATEEIAILRSQAVPEHLRAVSNEDLNNLADRTVIANATGNEVAFIQAVKRLIDGVRLYTSERTATPAAEVKK